MLKITDNNTFKLIGGNFLGQAIAFASMPLITRFYTPDEFGVFSTALALILVISPVASLRYNTAIVVAADEGGARHLLSLSIILNLFIGLASLLIIFLLSNTYFEIALGFHKNFFYSIPAGIVLIGAVQTFIYQNVRQKAFKKLALSKIFDSLFDRVFAILVVLIYPIGSWGLIFGRLVGSFIAMICLSSGLKPNIIYLFKKISLLRMQEVARTYKNFPLYDTLATLMGSIYLQIPIFLFTYCYSLEIAGYYGLSIRTAHMPLMIFGDAIFKTYFSRVSQQKAEIEKVRRDTLRLFEHLAIISLPTFVAMAFFGQSIFTILFGEQWATAGFYLQLLAPSFFFLFIQRPYAALFFVYNHQKQKMVFELMNMIGRIAAVFIPYYIGLPGMYSVMALSLTTSVIGILYMTASLRILNIGYGKMFKVICIGFVYSSPMIISGIAVYIREVEATVQFVIFVLSMIICYAIITINLKITEAKV